MRAEIADNTGGILCARITGTLTHPELVALIKVASDIISRQGKARLLVPVEEFKGWERGGDWGDLCFQSEHDAHIGKTTIVGHKEWEDLALIFASKRFRSFPVDFFQPADLAQTRAWLAKTPK